MESRILLWTNYLSQTFSLYQIGCTWIIRQSPNQAPNCGGSKRQYKKMGNQNSTNSMLIFYPLTSSSLINRYTRLLISMFLGCAWAAQPHKTLQVTKFKMYKTWDPKVRLYIVIVLSCPLIGSLSSSTANQRVAQNNCFIELDFGDPIICTT